MKIAKWGARVLRLLVAKACLGNRLQVRYGDKPVYLGRGMRFMAKRSSAIHLDGGLYWCPRVLACPVGRGNRQC